MFVFNGKACRVDVEVVLLDVSAVGCEVTKVRKYCTRLSVSRRRERERACSTFAL
jgi:hypothetical protein